MLSLRAVKAALVKALSRVAEVPVFFDNVEKRDGAYFYVELRPAASFFGGPYRDRRVAVSLDYVPEEDADGRVDRMTLYDVADKLELFLQPVLPIPDGMGGRFITVLDTSVNFYDEVLHYSFSLDFTDVVTDAELGREEGELAQELYINGKHEEE